MRLWSDPVWVARSPLVTTVLLEAANVQQMWQMWQMWVVDHSASGQSRTAWLSVQAALWLNFYRVMTPGAVWAIRCQAFGIALNMAVVLAVFYWRM